MTLPKFLQNPLCYVALTLVALQFVAGTVLDLLIGAALVGMIAFQQKD